VDEEYISVINTGLIRCMYVCTPKGRPAYIHFPNRANDYEIQGYSCLVRQSVRHQNKSHSTTIYLNILSPMIPTCISCKHRGSSNKNQVSKLCGAQPCFTSKIFFGCPITFSHYIELLCSI